MAVPTMRFLNKLEVMFSYHGHPLSRYEFEESIDSKRHDIAVAAAKKRTLN
jgi:hypothetical protein